MLWYYHLRLLLKKNCFRRFKIYYHITYKFKWSESRKMVFFVVKVVCVDVSKSLYIFNIYNSTRAKIDHTLSAPFCPVPFIIQPCIQVFKQKLDDLHNIVASKKKHHITWSSFNVLKKNIILFWSNSKSASDVKPGKWPGQHIT